MFGSAPKTKAQQQPILQGIRVTQSLYNVALPLIYGTQRVPALLLDYTDFKVIPVTTQQSAGGKGFGGGGNSKSTTYDYKAAVVLGLCHGPVTGLANVWDAKGVLQVTSVSESFVVPGGGGSVAVANAGSNFMRDLGIGRDDPYSVAIDDYGDPDGPRVLSGTHRSPLSAVTSGPALGEYSHDGAGTYTFSAADAGKNVTITYVYAIPDATDSGKPAQILSLTLIPGEIGQAPWSYMLSAHPDRAIGYSGIALLVNSAMDLGSSADLPSYTYELIGLFPFGAGIIDANPKDILTDWIGHSFRGANHPEMLGDLSSYSDYCVALGLFLSPLLDQQQGALQWIRELLDTTNSECVWSEGVLKIVPYGDSTVVGNGAVYTPNTTPVVDLSDDDFIIHEDGEEPLEIPRTSSGECKNKVVIEWVNRSNAYNTEPLPDEDIASIQTFGLRVDDSVRRHMITTLPAAKTSANLTLLRELFQRRQFKFTIDERYIFLEPMDLVTLTEKNLGLNKFPARLLEIQENEEGDLECVAEEFLFGTATPTLYAKQTGNGTAATALADPGNVNAPIIFEPPDALTKTGSYELWMGISGSNDNWGGATVFASPDGSSYKRAGRQFGAARTGTLQADFAIGVAHDLTHTLDVDLAESKGVLLSGTDDDRDSNRTLCWVGTAGSEWELISYKTATLVSGNRYHLTDVNRGVYGTPILDHPMGSRFLRLDDAVLVLDFDALDVGKTAYFKFCSFNAYGLKEQSQAGVTAYTFDVAGLFNNSSQIVSNDAVVDAIGTPGGGPYTAATVRAYSSVGGVGSDVNCKKFDGTPKVVPGPIQFTAQALSTWYWVILNPISGLTYLVTSVSARDQALFNGHICLGSTQSPDAAGSGGFTGGGGGGTGGGDGGGSFCPTTRMQVRSELVCSSVTGGTVLDCIHPVGGAKFRKAAVRSILVTQQPCVRLTSKNGAVKEVSKSTPFTLPSGENCYAPQMIGRLVWTDDGPDTPSVLDPIVKIEDIGLQDVMAIDLGGESFAAGITWTKRMYSHNNNKPLI